MEVEQSKTVRLGTKVTQRDGPIVSEQRHGRLWKRALGQSFSRERRHRLADEVKERLGFAHDDI
jgi:hypothetical protein